MNSRLFQEPTPGSFLKFKQFFENRKILLWKSLSKGHFFTDFVSLRVTFSAKFSLSKGQGSEVWHAHTQHPPTLVPPPLPGFNYPPGIKIFVLSALL